MGPMWQRVWWSFLAREMLEDMQWTICSHGKSWHLQTISFSDFWVKVASWCLRTMFWMCFSVHDSRWLLCGLVTCGKQMFLVVFDLWEVWLYQASQFRLDTFGLNEKWLGCLAQGSFTTPSEQRHEHRLTLVGLCSEKRAGSLLWVSASSVCRTCLDLDDLTAWRFALRGFWICCLDFRKVSNCVALWTWASLQVRTCA